MAPFVSSPLHSTCLQVEQRTHKCTQMVQQRAEGSKNKSRASQAEIIFVSGSMHVQLQTPWRNSHSCCTFFPMSLFDDTCMKGKCRLGYQIANNVSLSYNLFPITCFDTLAPLCKLPASCFLGLSQSCFRDCYWTLKFHKYCKNIWPCHQCLCR